MTETQQDSLLGPQPEADGAVGVVLYLAEIWLAAGLFARGVLHVIIWSALRERQGHEPTAVHPMDVEFGLRGDTAVLEDDVADQPSRAFRCKVQAITAFVGGLLIVSYVGAASSVTMPVVTAIAVGPSAVFVIGDPLWGLVHDLTGGLNT